MALLLLSGLALVNALPSATIAQVRSIAPPSTRDPYAAQIAEAATRFRVPPAWIRAVLRVESAGNPWARSCKGAKGLMQIMPDTWADLRVRHRLGNDPYDPRDSIMAGAGYIRELFDRYGTPGWIAAYNAGPGRYEASLSGRPLPLETRAYIAVITTAIGGKGLVSPIAATIADPPSWTRALLFAVQAERKPAASSVPADGSTDDAPTAQSVRDVSAIVPQADGLFIKRIRERNAP